jgi:hypothetical protein
MTTMQVWIEYGFSPVDKYTHKMLFNAGDTANKTGGSGTINLSDLTVAADQAPMAFAITYAKNYLKLAQEIVQPGVQVLAAYAEQYSDAGDWGSKTVIYSASWDVINFTPKVGNLGDGGPRGRKFIGGRQAIAATHKYGWLRWHFISRTYLDLPTLLSPSEISTIFAAWYPNLRNFASGGLGYATITSALSVEPQVTSKDLPSTVLHQGVRNG